MKEKGIVFESAEHKQFFYENMEKVRKKDVYHQALIYTLGIDSSCREHIHNIYDFATRRVKPECIKEGWQTSGSLRVTRLAMNLFSNFCPTILLPELDDEERLLECRQYGVEEIFSCGYAPYFWQAIILRYPEYCGRE